MDRGGSTPAGDGSPRPGLMSSVDDTLGELRAMLSALGDLVAVEGRLAASSVSLILGLGVATGVLLVSVWLLLIAAGVTLAVAVDRAWPIALVLAAGCNGLAALLTWAWIRRLTRNLTFPEVRARLAGTGEPSRASDPAAGA